MTRKGIILAGGTGSRLQPMTMAVSKHLLPVFDKPMVYYPLSVLMLAGIREVLIITTPEDQPGFVRLLGSGRQWGIEISYAVQPVPEGVAQAFTVAADFLAGHPSALVLGDNVLYGHGLQPVLKRAAAQVSGATAFAWRVENPERYGVIALADDGSVRCIEEKPKFPQTDWAVIGLYFCDASVVERSRSLKRSARGELEITDLNNGYLKDGALKIERLGRGFVWFDAGTPASLLEAAEFIHVVQRRQRQLIASPEEIALRSGWITVDELTRQAEKHGNTAYGSALTALLTEPSDPFLRFKGPAG